jgi:hypothetical protein
MRESIGWRGRKEDGGRGKRREKERERRKK